MVTSLLSMSNADHATPTVANLYQHSIANFTLGTVKASVRNSTAERLCI